jgi:hypothetical protein
MEVISLQTTSQNLHQSHFLHLLFDRWVVTDVVQYIETHEEQFVLFPNQHIQFFKLRLSRDPIILVVASPHLNVLTV